MLDTINHDQADWRQRPIIVCDPLPFSRRLTVDILRYTGAERVQTCANAEAAVYFAEHARDPILVVDWRDERLDAAQAVRKLRNSKTKARSCPSMILSTRQRTLDVETARDCGVDTVALRPIAPRDVIDRLTEITKNPRQFVASETYNGPDRRVHGKDETSPFKRDLDIASGLTTPIKAVHAQAQSIIFSMLRRGDEFSARVGRSLERYLQSVDQLGDREAEVIRLHRVSLGKLAGMPHETEKTRHDVVNGLEKLVQRKMRA